MKTGYLELQAPYFDPERRVWFLPSNKWDGFNDRETLERLRSKLCLNGVDSPCVAVTFGNIVVTLDKQKLFQFFNRYLACPAFRDGLNDGLDNFGIQVDGEEVGVWIENEYEFSAFLRQFVKLFNIGDDK